MNQHIYYVCGGRSFFSDKLGRKMYEAVRSFEKVIPITLFCGGDYLKKRLISSTAVASIKGRTQNRSVFKDFLVNTIAEIRDLINDQRVYAALSKGVIPQCVVERSARFCYAGYRYAKKNKIPYVLEWKDHLLDYRYSLFKRWASSVERRKIQNADFIFIESNVLKRILVQGGANPLQIVDDFKGCIGTLPKKGVDPNKVIVTYNAVNPDEFVKNAELRRDVRKRLNISENDLVVGYCGSYAFYHDSIRMILAADELRKRGFSNVKWLLVGSGKDYEECRSEAEKRGLLGTVVAMIPRVPKEEVPQYLSAFDLAILPGSTDIICPIKVMEYMAAETATLVPDYECNREVVSEDCGVLFKPFSEQDLADKIAELAKKPERLVVLGKKAREVVLDRFVWEKTYGRALKLVLSQIETTNRSL